ncbi:hypothetical protein F5Y11DRAFT_242932 [Daldinia sp. FL1419]|nr:hypothetical protein F5Y11DRAFT_242932 [Daldinia sp. FL1419]
MPNTAQPWLKANRMRRFITAETPSAIHNAASNKIQVRRDVRKLWDNNVLVLVPKPDAADQSRYKLTSHLFAFLDQHISIYTEAHILFHNRPCLPIPHVPIEMLFARFARALFTNGVIKIFADNPKDEVYSVLLLQQNEQGARELTQQTLPLNKLRDLLSKETAVRGAASNKRDHSQISKSHNQVGKFDEESDEESDEEADEYNAGLLRRNRIFSIRTGQIEPDSDSDSEYSI